MNRFVVTMGTFTGSPGSGTISAGAKGQTITYNLAGERATSTDATSGTTTYTYTIGGRIATVKIGGVLRARYTYDVMGRVVDYKEYKTDGTTVCYEKQSTYNQKSQLWQDTVTDVRSDGTFVTTTNYAYYADTDQDGVYGARRRRCSD